MRIALALLLTIHGLIHVMGFAKAFDLAKLEALKEPISKPMGIVWLAGAILFVGAVVALWASPRAFWAVAAAAIVVSQIAIASAWSDAKVGTAANVVALVAAVYGAFAWGPFGLTARYEELSRAVLRGAPAAGLVTEDDLARLPKPVARYLRGVGVVGKPRVTSYRVRMKGRIRASADAPWMEFTAEQHSRVEPLTRLFSMKATMKGLPVDVLHTYLADGAEMRVRVLSLYPMVDASGAGLTRTETVTVLNDMCLLAPATLLDPRLTWDSIDDRSVGVTLKNGEHAVHATLSFGDDGALASFVSDDRPALAEDNRTFVPQRWSTPVHAYGSFGPYRLPARGDARYAPASGEFAYAEMEMTDYAFNPGAEASP
jgi:hypothetical protein